MKREQIEQQLAEQGIRCHSMSQTRSGFMTEAHYTSPDAPQRNLQLRIVVDGDVANVFVFEEVKMIRIESIVTAEPPADK